MSYNNINELRGKIEAYRSRELNGERLPRDEFEHYIGLKRELYHIESKQRVQAKSELIPIHYKPMLVRQEEKSRLRMLLDRFRRWE